MIIPSRLRNRQSTSMCGPDGLRRNKPSTRRGAAVGDRQPLGVDDCSGDVSHLLLVGRATRGAASPVASLGAKAAANYGARRSAPGAALLAIGGGRLCENSDLCCADAAQYSFGARSLGQEHVVKEVGRIQNMWVPLRHEAFRRFAGFTQRKRVDRRKHQIEQKPRNFYPHKLQRF